MRGLMRILTRVPLTWGLLVAAAVAVSIATAQRPDPSPETGPSPADSDDLVVRGMMEFDKDKEGKLKRSELTDQRLHRLFDRADTNKDGIVTKQELTALAARERSGLSAREQSGLSAREQSGLSAREQSSERAGPPRFGRGGGPGRFMMRPPRPGDILPEMVQERLRLTPE